MVLVEGGTFSMGSTENSDEKPIHSVTLDSYYISKYEVTQVEFESIMGFNTSNFKGERNPVEQVSWYDAAAYCNKLSELEGLGVFYSISGIEKNDKGNITKATVTTNGGKGYRLPTEAEWEYAARGGNKSNGYKFSGSDNVDEVAEYAGNNNKSTKPVGGKKANELGIYDMSGNVWEWCWDWYDSSYYGKSPSDNPAGPSSGSYRVFRGGSWYSSSDFSRVASRNYNSPYYVSYSLGFRVLRTY